MLQVEKIEKRRTPETKMMKKNVKTSKRLFFVLLLTSLVGVTGCSAPQKNLITNETEVSSATSISQSEEDTKEESTVAETSEDNGKIEQYIALIGQSKEELVASLGEEPVVIDEGGLEFKKTGIRVWFDPEENRAVQQIFVMNPDFDILGVKIGDKISSFKEVLDDPVSDGNGDAHFKYKDVYLSINYDTNSEETYGLYILKNDF